MPTPYLTFDGTCSEAFSFYEQVLGAKPVSRFTFGDSPMAKDVPAEFHGRVMHGTISINGASLMASDAGPWAPYEGAMRSCALSLSYATTEEAARIFAALGEGGAITMPFAKTFWAEGFGMLVDRFGVAWMVNVDHPKA